MVVHCILHIFCVRCAASIVIDLLACALGSAPPNDKSSSEDPTLIRDMMATAQHSLTCERVTPRASSAIVTL